MPGISARVGLLSLLGLFSARADEGMWLFNRPPVRQVQEKYGFEIKQDWLDHLQRSAVKFGGGSGSFVSPHGLILTNHHVGRGQVEKLSTPDNDMLAKGFLAKSEADELKCQGLELNVLMSIEDVTSRVAAALVSTVAPTPEDAAAARRKAIAEIEKESQDKTGLKSTVVTLYQGGAYHLYRYKKYTDVRLVFAPDMFAAAFGGDPDNFEYPRYCLDMTFFRVYEDGKPADTPDYLKWSAKGAQDSELVFVTGHPGRTNRSNTLAELEDMRDRSLPPRLEQTYRSEAILSAWAERDKENRRRAIGMITGIQNGRKNSQARLEGLLDPGFMAKKAADENAFRAKLRQSPEWKSADEAFDRLAKVQNDENALSERDRMLESGEAFSSSLFARAKTLLRAAAETPKPDSERLREYQSQARPSMELGLFSEDPVYKDLEVVRLTSSLTVLCEKVGVTDPLVQQIMAGKPPQARALELVEGTTLEKVEVRRALYDGGMKAIEASQDPMILLAKLVDETTRAYRKKTDTLGEIAVQAHQKIALAQFALGGDDIYPDATGTLRLSYGVAKGYQSGKTTIPWTTTISGLYERAQKEDNVPPFNLSPVWDGKQAALKLDTPYNFISTADIIGGNSGSPVVNRAGELVGLVFDGNYESLVIGFGYTETQARCVSVHSAGILEALKSIYHADWLLKEIAPQG